MDEEFPISITPAPVESAIFFKPETDKWAIKVTSEGVVFNRECYPNSTPEAFVKLFIDLLEKCYTVKFYQKEPEFLQESNTCE
jgi:hypothetical protein